MKLFFFTVVVCFPVVSLFAQGEANSLKGVPIKERIVTGGGLGFDSNRTQDYFSIAPSIGYQITKRLVAGTGLTYQYRKFKIPNPDIKMNIYAVSPFARFTVYQNFFLQGEYEYMNFDDPYQEKRRDSFSSFMAGGGVIYPISESVGFYAIALYNFSYREPKANEFVPYTSPWVLRIGINAGGFMF